MSKGMQEVEVVDICPNCGGVGEAWYTHETRFPLGCHTCHRSGAIVIPRECAPGSITEARLRLADAAEAWYAMPNGNTKAEAEAIGAVFTKACRDLAALRTTRKTGSGDAVHVTSAKAENGAPE